MKEYKCYFDASHKEVTARCAYYIEHNGFMYHSDVIEATIGSSVKAEARALHELLVYIESHIDKNSKLFIYGDALSVINSVLCGRNKKYRKTNGLLKRMRRCFDINLEFIPRKENRIADKLSKGKPLKQNQCDPIKTISVDLNKFASIKLSNAIPKRLGGKVLVEQKRIAVADIVIPRPLRYSHFSKDKYKQRLEYFTKNGCLYKNVHIDKNNTLIDGYISYLILKQHDVAECDVEIYKASDVE